MFLSRQKHRTSLTGKKQSGVAIITALLIVTIAATVSITISTQLQLDVRRTGNLIALDQADMYISMAENLAREKLQDPDAFPTIMSTIREEGKIEFPYLLENATIYGQLTDLNSCINLNSLIDLTLPPPSINVLTQARLTRLFNNNGVPASMIAAIIDWIDVDSATTRTPDGGEDGHYLNLENPYYTANQPLSSITELRLIKGAENFNATPTHTPYLNYLALTEAFRVGTDNWPSVCAFNTNAGPALINVNTASRDVLMALSPTMTQAIANDIITCRGPQPQGNEFANRNDFTRCSSVSTIIMGNDLEQLAYSSNYFLLKTTVKIGDAKKITYSIIFRTATTTEIVARTQRTL